MTDVTELLNKVQDEQVRQQLSEQFDALSGSKLRSQLDEALTENKTLKQERRHGKYVEAGLPEGAYDIFDEKYEGELTVDGLKAFAQEKGFALPTGNTDEGQPSGETPQPDAAQQRQSGEDRLSQLGQGQIPARDPSVGDQIKQAEAKGIETGDWSEFDRLQASSVLNLGAQ